ncbi:MAG: ATP-binding protein [Planctomycetaceae bacterium]|nr:ATP-binding protein [Planctomycetaceae bacterium]
MNVLAELRTAEYRTIGIDTLEALERMIYSEICRQAKSGSIEKAFGGYGKGYVAAGETTVKILDSLSALIPFRKMPVLLGQCDVKTVSDPEGEFSMFVPRANKNVALPRAGGCAAGCYSKLTLPNKSNTESKTLLRFCGSKRK